MSVIASLGLIELFEVDFITVSFTDPLNIDMTTSDWKVRFSDQSLYSNYVGPTFSSVDGGLIRTPTSVTAMINPINQGMGVPDSQDTKCYYFDVLQITGAVTQTRAQCTLKVHRSITLP